MENNKILSTTDRTRLLSVYTSIYFFSGFAAISFAPLLPFIQEDLLLNKVQLGLFISSLYLGSIVAGIPTGWLADKWGIPKTILLGLLIQGAGIGIFSFMPSYSLMITFIFIAGLGFGSINPATSKGIITCFAINWRATAMAIKQMGFTGGTMAVAAILPVTAVAVGWRAAMFLVAIILILCGIITFFLYPQSITEKKKTGGQQSPLVKTGSDEPIWKNKKIIYWSILCIFYAIVQFSVTGYLAVYMVDYFSYSKVLAGIFLSITQGGGALGRVIWGRVSDVYFAKNRDREIIIIGFITAAMCILMGLMPHTTHYIIIGIIATIFGFTAIGYNALFLTMIGEIAGPEKAGQATGFAVTIAYCGVVIGPPLFGFTVDLIGYNYAWISLGGMLLAAIIITLLLTRYKSATRVPASSKIPVRKDPHQQ